MTKNTNPACAACKYQRKKCVPDCPLASFFPACRNQDFLKAHKLFGVSNMLKIIKSVKPSDQQKAMASIIFQANARYQDPVGGCYHILSELHRKINYLTAELYLVNQHLAVHRSGGKVNVAELFDEMSVGLNESEVFESETVDGSSPLVDQEEDLKPFVGSLDDKDMVQECFFQQCNGSGNMEEIGGKKEESCMK